MSLFLLISVRFHDGRYHGSGDWPPSPARLFQALVAAAAKPGLDASRDTLGWLEKLGAPTIAVPTNKKGRPLGLFVPNNDLDSVGGIANQIITRQGKKGTAIGFNRTGKSVQPRLFNASVPLLYVWRLTDDDKGGEKHAKSVCNIAEGLYQLGRGVDMAWAVGEVLDEAVADERLENYPGAIYRPSQGSKGVTLECPQYGSLKSLMERHEAGSMRFHHIRDEKGKIVRTEFSNAPRPRFRSVSYNSPATLLLYELRRTTERGAPFAPWPLKAAAALVRTLRDSACERLAPHFEGSGVVDKALIGRDATEADKKLRIRIIPFPSIGHPHADHGIRRVLVEVPPDCPIRSDDVAWSFAGLEVAEPVLDAETGEILSSPVELVKADDDSMLLHYGIGEDRASRVWRSVTPLALPEDARRRRIDPANKRKEAKDGKERIEEERNACRAVMQALRHAGLREKVIGLCVQREPFEGKGERVESFASGTRFSKHQLWHVMIEFVAPVSGPLVLGCGRYTGLGVMATQ
ncbi:type I-U CRISPR-associated protein Csb2 [Acidihalobacter ferrooxydans]|uniref:Type I-U CRISPR-associated protein Cas5/Cas6 n=1 Tax=Acidihalobacter ferrooxydans TaxID=1765967 RepID=A0A1P8UKK7_9GAMM|nr:type I-U CRISPR-associated protein Csb2 [Acidihalobacter ferrooxydans]APZ44302.1 type I-U CRISPR-associated protein Cas5/Cas6 [Acidihalobacter ferrooxydans]